MGNVGSGVSWSFCFLVRVHDGGVTVATLLVDSTPGGMMRAEVACLLATSVRSKAPTIPPDWENEGSSCEAFDNICNMSRRIDETPVQEELQHPTTESSLDPIIAPVLT